LVVKVVIVAGFIRSKIGSHVAILRSVVEETETELLDTET
jgi:hypothetical protein